MARCSAVQHPTSGGKTSRGKLPRRPAIFALLLALVVGCGDVDPASEPPRDGSTAPADAAPATTDGGADACAIDCAPGPVSIVPLYDARTPLEPAVVELTPEALVTRFADRARDRHAREDQFQAYEHFLHLYWEHRTAQVEIVDTVARGGDHITFHVTTEWKLDDHQAELRFFYRGIGTVAEYHDNLPMTPIDTLHYTRTVRFNAREGRPLRIGDKMEFELSQFLDSPPRGRDNYYGTTYLYVVGRGLVPWEGTGERRDSEIIAEEAWLGGQTTLHRNESNEPESLFLQMATNLAPQNGQPFVRGRRAVHTDFGDGSHDESPLNPPWDEQAGKLGPRYVAPSCNTCHLQNGRALPAAPGVPLTQWVFRVGDAEGNPDPLLGRVLQPHATLGAGEGAVTITHYLEEGELRRPVFAFEGASPTHYSPRIAPALVGLGLLEAIAEADVLALADPDDADGDGISGRARVVRDPITGEPRLGRFGWKASQASLLHQIAAALRTDMGVLTSIFPTPDCGAAQTDCGPEGAELDDEILGELMTYVALLGVHAQRDARDPQVTRGAALFEEAGCARCHTPRFVTSAFHPFAELRAQTIAPYTDLLLHDMGPGLADTLRDGDASPSEWRTPPLWSLGLMAGVSGGEAYLHDGRARTLREAILWHGGEGEASRDAFLSMREDERDAVLAFLRSL